MAGVDSFDVLALHGAATWALVGLAWTVQRVQYPAFGRVGACELRAYHAQHCARMGQVVGPLMLLELASAVALVAAPPAGVPGWMPWTGLALVALLWGSTGLVAVPLHRRLGRGPAEAERAAVQRALLRVNGARVALWSLRGAGVLAALVLARGGA